MSANPQHLTIALVEAFDRVAQPVQEGVETIVEALSAAGSATIRVGQGALQVGKTVYSDVLNYLSGQAPDRMRLAVQSPLESGTINLLYGVGGVYRFTCDEQPSQPVTLSITYQESEVSGFDESTLQIYRFDESNQKWELLGGQVDTNANTVTTSVTELGIFALAPPLPTGDLQFAIDQPLAPADGNTVITAQASNLLMNNGAPVPDGWAYTVSANDADIVSTDQEATIDGVQILSLGGSINIQFRAPVSGGVASFVVTSIYGDAQGQGMIAFTDATPPPAVTGVAVVAGQSKLHVSWSADDMPGDLAGYRVYYSENHTGPPFDGTAMVDGSPSPADVATNSVVLRGLNMGSTYYVAVSARDSSGNEGPLSSVATATTVQSPPGPPVDVRYQDDGAGNYIVSWSLSEDDEFNDRDVDHYEINRGIVGATGWTKVVDVSASQALYTDSPGVLPPGSEVVYLVVAVDTVGLRSSAEGASVPGDSDSDGDVDGTDFEAFAMCTSGPAIPYVGDCAGFDFDTDNDVDQSDFGILQRCYSGSGNPADPNCAN